VSGALPHTPRQLFRQYDLGEISREEFREAMRLHAESLIEEMVEVHENPLAAWMEMLRNRRLASRLSREHGDKLVRDVFVALSEVPDFPIAPWLWNADQAHLPLYCFLRSRREPLFRVLKINSAAFLLTISVEYGSVAKGAATREKFTLHRDHRGRLIVSERERL
jgi:hypothetical protein